MTALSMMLFHGLWIWPYLGEFLLWIAAALTFITGYQYFQKSVDYIKTLEKAKTVEAKIVIKPQTKVVKKAAKKTAAKKAPIKKAVSAKKSTKKTTAKK